MSRKTTLILLATILFIGGIVFYSGDVKTPTPASEKKVELARGETPFGTTTSPTNDGTMIVTVLDLDQNPVEVNVSDWPYYKNNVLNFQFRYPPWYRVVREENPTYADDLDLLLILATEDEDVSSLEWFFNFRFYQEFDASKVHFINRVWNQLLPRRTLKPYYVANLDTDLWYFADKQERPIWSYLAWFEHKGYDVEVELNYDPISSHKIILLVEQEKEMELFQAVLATFKEIE